MPIRTVADLRGHLKLAIEVELSTVPPYLYSMWSIEDQPSDAARLIRSIVTEEMLHVTLATNLLLAVGGEIDFTDPAIRPRYPRPLPHHRPPLPLHLAPMSDEVVRDTLMVIERPEGAEAPPEADRYDTLGQFYLALEMAIEALDANGDLFADHQPDRQLSDPRYYGAVDFDAEDSGGLVLVSDAASARDAIEIIVHQGEGLRDEKWADPEHRELTHYRKLLQLHEGEVPIGAVRPALVDPRVATLPAEVRPVAGLFNALNDYLFVTLDEIFRPGANQGALIGRLYRIMEKLLAPTGRYLMTLPVGGGLVAGPTFEPGRLGSDPKAEVAALAAAVAADHPDLAHVAELLAGGR
jgi:hypothetical protein